MAKITKIVPVPVPTTVVIEMTEDEAKQLATFMYYQLRCDTALYKGFYHDIVKSLGLPPYVGYSNVFV